MINYYNTSATQESISNTLYVGSSASFIFIDGDDPVKALKTLVINIEETINTLKEKDLLNDDKVIELMNKLNNLSLQ